MHFPHLGGSGAFAQLLWERWGGGIALTDSRVRRLAGRSIAEAPADSSGISLPAGRRAIAGLDFIGFDRAARGGGEDCLADACQSPRGSIVIHQTGQKPNGIRLTTTSDVGAIHWHIYHAARSLEAIAAG